MVAGDWRFGSEGIFTASCNPLSGMVFIMEPALVQVWTVGKSKVDSLCVWGAHVKTSVSKVRQT